jgi:hypothetical protein
VSPAPSGAHRHADVRRAAGALRLAGWVAGAERVVLQLDPGAVLGWLDGGRVPPARLALGLALRRPASVLVELSPIRGRLDERSVRAVLGPAERVVAASPADRSVLVAAGLPGGKVGVAERAEARPAPVSEPEPELQPSIDRADPGPWRLGPEPTREELEAEIRRRAAIRSGGTGGEMALRQPDGTLPGTAASRPLLAIPPLGPAPARSAKPGVGLVKQAVRRLVGWQVDPVIEHVNRLHRAMLEAIEARGEPEA